MMGTDIKWGKYDPKVGVKMNISVADIEQAIRFWLLAKIDDSYTVPCAVIFDIEPDGKFNGAEVQFKNVRSK